jgi:hypothetical protein
MLKLNSNKTPFRSLLLCNLAQVLSLLIPLQYDRQCFAVFNLASRASFVKHVRMSIGLFKLNWMITEAERAGASLCHQCGISLFSCSLLRRLGAAIL